MENIEQNNQAKASIEDIVLAHPNDFETYGMRTHGRELEEAMEDVAQLDKNATLFDVLELDDFYKLGNWPSSAYMRYAANLVKYRMNLAEVVASSRNLLNPVPAGVSWEDGYKNAVAQFLAAEANPLSYEANHYGWLDYKFSQTKNTIVAILRFKEDAWSEFVGTFTAADEKHGVLAEAIYSDGSNRFVRWEGSLAEIIQKVVTM